MDFNPYQPPRSTDAPSPDDAVLRLGHVYRAINILYLVVLLAGTAVIVADRPPLDLRTAAATLVYYAPAICFVVMCWAARRTAMRFLGAYTAYVLVLVAIFIWNLTTPLPDIRIGLQIVGINFMALVGAFVQVRRKPLEPPTPSR